MHKTLTRISRRWWLTMAFLGAAMSSAQSAEFDHSDWDRLLASHVVAIGDGYATAVDYAGFAKDRVALNRYLERLANVSEATFDSWPEADQLAFLINVYNAWTVELILTRYPDLDSIRDLGSLFSSPWKKSFVRLFDNSVTLDHVEHTLIRGSGRYNEPRIHFAVNCASVGCPALASEAYRGSEIDRQLDAATDRFLRDNSRNRFRDGRLEVSSIFKWYRDDFETGWRGAESLGAFLALYPESLGLSAADAARAADGDIRIRFLSYDWALNDTR